MQEFLFEMKTSRRLEEVIKTQSTRHLISLTMSKLQDVDTCALTFVLGQELRKSISGNDNVFVCSNADSCRHGSFATA